MATDSLNLNIPGAQGDVSSLTSTRGNIESTAGELKYVSAKLFQGVLVGCGADAGSDFSAQIDSAVTSANDVIQRLTQIVNDAIDNTVGYDRSGFPSVFG